MANESFESLDPMAATVQFGRYLIEVDMFPAFLMSHFVIACLLIREDSKDLGPMFRQNHPFASWVCSLLAGLAGVFVISFLFGEPLVDVMKEDQLVIILTVIWYLVNYCPFDLFYKMARTPLVFITLAIFQEGLRVRCIFQGLEQAAKTYPGSFTVTLLGGAINGNGYGYIKIVERLVRGKWTPGSNEILEVTYFAKSGLYSSVALMLQNVGILPLRVEIVYLVVFAAFVVCRILIIVSPVQDPLLPIEAPICKILFGSGDVTTSKAAAFAKGDSGKDDKKKQ